MLRSVARRHHEAKALASVAAGVPTVTMESILDEDVPVFRLMPNVGVQVCPGTVCFATGRLADTPPRRACSTGSGCSAPSCGSRSASSTPRRRCPARAPAFIGLVVEAFEDAGIVAGLTHSKSRELILTTMPGTAALLAEHDLPCRTSGGW